MPLAETFWALRFGMLTDRFEISWMMKCEKPVRGWALSGLEQVLAGAGDFGDCLIERGLVGARRLAETADFSNELKSGAGDFLVGGGLAG